MSYRIIHRNPRAIIFFAKMLAFAAIAFAFYTKYFEDKVVLETADVATVVEVTQAEGQGVGSNRAIMLLELDDGTKAKTFANMNTPDVGTSVDVKIQTFESGKKKILLAEQF